MNLRSSKTKLFCETSLNNDRSTTHLTSELQYVLRSAQTTCFHRLPRMVADRNVTYTTSLCFHWLLQLNVDVSYSRVVPILAACTYDPLPKVVRVYMRSLFRVYMRPPRPWQRIWDTWCYLVIICSTVVRIVQHFSDCKELYCIDCLCPTTF